MGKEISGGVGGSGGGSGGNPFANPGSAMMRYEEKTPEVYEAEVFGEKIRFATEADYLKAKMALQKRMGGSAARGSSSNDDGGGIFGGNFLETAGVGLQTVGAFLAGRNLNEKIDALDDALDEQAAARAEIEQLRTNVSVAALITPLLRFLDAERTATETAQAALEDQVLAQDLQAGGGVAQLVSKFTKGGYGDSGSGSTGGIGTIAAVGIGGLGLGALMSKRNNNNTTSRNRRRR
jgi:hypothetical protein